MKYLKRFNESLPLEEEVKRQLVRITLPADAEDLV
jgi:hypothetical protein